MTQEEKNILENYANAKFAESEAKDIVDLLSDSVKEIINKYTTGEPGDKVIIDTGNYSISKRRKYEYPEETEVEVTKLKEEISNIYKLAEQKGTANYVENVSVTFRKSNGN